jgi:hypothetical protein
MRVQQKNSTGQIDIIYDPKKPIKTTQTLSIINKKNVFNSKATSNIGQGLGGVGDSIFGFEGTKNFLDKGKRSVGSELGGGFAVDGALFLKTCLTANAISVDKKI